MQIKADEEKPEWTCLSAPVDKDGNVLAGREYIPPSTGLATLGKKGADSELLATLTMSLGLKIPTVPTGQEPNREMSTFRVYAGIQIHEEYHTASSF